MAPRKPDPELSGRQREILQAVMEHYIATAEPVGSRALTKANPGIELSPATVRNAMSDLEDLGLLESPHTSAGRIPTPIAFRIYVEQLASRGRISPKERELVHAVAQGWQGSGDITHVLQEAGRVLSTVSRHAALVLLPSAADIVLSDVEFIPVRDRAVLVMFVARSGLIQQRVVQVDFPLDRDELRSMANFMKSLLDGKNLSEVRQAILGHMRDERAEADRMMRRALELSEQGLVTPRADQVLLEGERTLLEQPEFADIARLRHLLRAFEEKTLLLRLLDAGTSIPQAAENQNTLVAFGVDGNVSELRDLAVIMAAYGADGGGSGQVGIVGPMRMDYSRIVPLVELTAGALSRSLSGGGEFSESSGAREENSSSRTK